MSSHEKQLKSLTDRFHTFVVYQQFHIRKDGAFASIWQLSELNQLCLARADFEYYTEAIHGLFKMLPDYVQVQFIYDKYPVENSDPSKQWLRPRKNEIKRLFDYRNALTHPYYKTDVFLIINWNHLLYERKVRTINDHFIFSARKATQLIREKFNQDSAIIRKLEQQVEQELHFFQPYRLNDAQILCLLANYYNLEHCFAFSRTIRNEYLNADLVHKQMAWDKSGLFIGRDNICMTSLFELPSKVINPICNGRFAQSPMAPFLDFPFPLRLILNFEKLPQHLAIKKVKQIKHMNKGFAGYNVLAAQKIYEIEGLIDEHNGEVIFEGLEHVLELGQDFLVHFSMNLYTWDTDKACMAHREMDMIRQYEKFSNAKGMVENQDALPVFLSCAPANYSNYRPLLLRGSNAAHFINLCNHYKGTKQGISFLNTGGQIILYDLFSADNDNYNAIIIGPSGSGKSFLCSNIIHKYMEQGVKVAILDIGGSYKTLVKLLGGDYLEINKNAPTYLDPFHYFNPSQYPYESSLYFDAIKFIYSFIELMVIKSDQAQTELPKDHKGWIIKIIEAFFKNTHGKAVTIYDFLKYIQSDTHGLNTDSAFKSYMIQALDLYVNGALRRYFHPSNPLKLTLNLDGPNALFAFDLRGIDDEKELLPLYAFLITKIVANQLEKDYEHFIFIQDEAWKTLSESEAIRAFTLYFYRTARKYNGSIISITQNVRDFAEGELASAIMTNSDHKLLLKHRVEDSACAIDIFALSEAESVCFSQLKKHEVFISAKGQAVIVNVHFSPMDYWLYTTHPAERKKRDQALLESNGNLIRALSHLTN